SEDTVLVLAKPPGTGEGTAVVAEADNDPITVLETKDGVELLGPQGTDRELRIDLLTIDRDGAVVVAGRGTPGRALLIYIDNIFVTEVKIAESGSWQVRLPPVTPGQHILRVDQIDEEAVINRLEMQFNPDADTATEEDVIATDGNGRRPPDYTKTELVIVRKGYTLWGISRSKYGLGRLYVTIFEANDHLIKDPDLIYPGQIFIIPK
ncbi:MAG: LysM peptidoglycan-binding domain-containing protein, partial [Rhodobacteraceae bacterium]|nr:LysM peptidoglycan-binding domain-containing protein [Paracoccaceae bacterium]